MSSEHVLTLTGANFEDKVLKASGTVLVDFWAEWCGPCKMIAPLLEQIAEEHAGKVIIGKVDVDAQGELAGRYNIRAIPTMIVFKNGEKKEEIVGMTSKSNLVEKLGLTS
ncbi:MAG: thioredoxin [Candidatus Methylacidiphilales bacterium]